jgi:hypothetical protein
MHSSGRRIKVLPNELRFHNVDAVQGDQIHAGGMTGFSPGIDSMSVGTAHASAIGFSGIDLLEAGDGGVLVSEVNLPACIPRRNKPPAYP